MFRLPHRVLAGLIAGLLAGLAMALVLAIGNMAAGGPPLGPLILIAATLMGDAALLPSSGIGTLLFGTLVHLGLSALLGGLFATLTLSRSRLIVFAGGMLYGASVWALMRFAIFPSGVNLALIARLSDSVFALSHLAYGAGLIAMLPIEARLVRADLRNPPAAAPPNRLAS